MQIINQPKILIESEDNKNKQLVNYQILLDPSIQIENAKISLVKICYWICDLKPNAGSLDQLEAPANSVKQRDVRQSGLIELVLNIIYQIERFGLMKIALMQKESPLFSLVRVIIEFLRIVCRNSLSNSYYVSQWYHLLKNIILSNEISIEIKIDRLFQDLFHNSRIENTYQSDVALISNKIDFTKHNIQGLKLLLGFCQSIDSLDVTYQKKMINEIFQVNRNNIFRKFHYNTETQKLTFTISDNQVQNLDYILEQRNPGEFEYVLTTLQLTSQLCKGQSHLVIEYINELCPMSTCINTFENQNIHPKIRAIILDLFKASYLKNDSRYVIDTHYPNFLKVQETLPISEAIQEQTREQKEEFIFKYCTEIKYEGNELISVNLKDFLLASILDLRAGDLIKSEVPQDHLITSLLEILLFFLKKQFFDKHEISKIHTILDDLIKVSFTYLYEQKQQSQKSLIPTKPSAGMDYRKSLVWIIKCLQVLYFIELYEQDQILEQFFQLESSQELFTYSVETALIDRKIPPDFNEQRVQNQQQKQEQIQQFLTCLEVPDTEVIYYYLKLLVFNKNEVSSAVVKLIFQIFRTRTNVLTSFNNVYFIHYGNYEYYNKISESYYKMHILFTDIHNIIDDNQITQKADKIGKLYKVLVGVCKKLQVVQKFEIFIYQYLNNYTFLLNATYDKFTDDIDRKKIHAELLLQDHTTTNGQKEHTLNQQKSAFSQNLLAQIDDDQRIINELLQLEKDEVHNVMNEKAFETKFLEHGQVSNNQMEPLSSPTFDREDESLITDQNFTEGVYNTDAPLRESNFHKQENHPNNNQFVDKATRTFQKVLQFKHNAKKSLFKREGADRHFQWTILDEFIIDIRFIQQRQDILRHLNVYQLIIKIIRYFTSNESQHGDKQMNEEIIEKCLLVLIYFCIKNQKNANIIAESPDFQQLYHSILNHTYKYSDMQKYQLLFFSQIFQDNYHLLINLEKDQNEFFSNLTTQFKTSYSKKSFEYCVYYLQLLQYFFKVKSASLIQNQIWVFNQISKVHNLQHIFNKLLQHCLQEKIQQFKLEDDKHVIPISDEMTMLCNYLQLFQKLISSDKSSSKLMQEIRLFFPLNLIKKCLKNLDNFYFLKLEVINFLNLAFIQSKKLEEKEITYIMMIFQDVLKTQINHYIDNYQDISRNNHIFVTDKSNIFQQTTSYSSIEKIIGIPVSKSADNYIILGIIPAFDMYRLRNLSQASFNEVDYAFMDLYDSLLIQLNDLWTDLKYSKHDKVFRSKIIKGTVHIPQNKMMSLNPLSNPSQILNDVTLGQEKEVRFIILKEQLQQHVESIILSDKGIEVHRSLHPPMELERTQNIWDKIMGWKNDIIDQEQIEEEKLIELKMLVVKMPYFQIGLLVKIREESVPDFKKVIENLIGLLTDSNTLNLVRKQAVIILRELANFKDNEKQGKGIRNDLCELGFTNFLCEVISSDSTYQNDKLEYIITLIDFLDEGPNVQNSVMEFMVNDINNVFILSIKEFIDTNFNDFKEYEKGLQENVSDKIYNELREVIDTKIDACISGIKIFKMASEGHFSQMQNYLREQVVKDKPLKNSFNLITYAAKLFGVYSKLVTQYNVLFGEGIFDFLIEVIQGPCHPNQQVLCTTKILENLEDLIFDFNKDIDTFRIKHLMLAPFTKRIYLFIQSLFEGSQDPEIIEKIDNYLNPSVLLRRLKFIYKYVIKKPRRQLYKEILARIQQEDQDTQNDESEKKEEQKDNQLVEPDTKPISRALTTTKVRKPQQQLPGDEDIIFFLNLQDNDAQRMTIEQIEEKYEPMLTDLKDEGDYIYILLRNMKFQSSSFKEKLKKSKKDLIYTEYYYNPEEQELFSKTMMYYKLNTGRIEIINSLRQVQILFYPKPELALYLSESSKEIFLETVSRESANEKIMGLLNAKQDFIDEMKHYQFLLTNIPIDLDKAFTTIRLLALLCAFVINFLLLFDVHVEECEQCQGLDPSEDPCVCSPETPTLLGPGIDVFGNVLFSINLLSFVLWACLKLKLDLLNAVNQFRLEIHMREKSLKTRKNQNSNQLDMPKEMREAAEFMQHLFQENVEKYYYIAQYLAINSYFLYLSAFALINVMGIYYNRIFYTMLLLDIIEKSMILQNVVKAITINSTQLIMTGLLGIVIMFIYGILGYYTQTIHNTIVGVDIEVPLCTDPFNCFMFMLNIGLRAGGGVGEPIDSPQPDTSEYYARYFFDMTFFILIIVIWKNVIFGIIIDTFASLRDKKNSQGIFYLDRRNKCYICNLERTVFVKNGILFEKHTEKEHNVWNYFFYIVYLQEKDETDYNGTESDIQDKIKDDDISWFPIGKAQSLQSLDEEEQDHPQKLLQQIEENLGSLMESLNIKNKVPIKQ